MRKDLYCLCRGWGMVIQNDSHRHKSCLPESSQFKTVIIKYKSGPDGENIPKNTKWWVDVSLNRVKSASVGLGNCEVRLRTGFSLLWLGQLDAACSRKAKSQVGPSGWYLYLLEVSPSASQWSPAWTSVCGSCQRVAVFCLFLLVIPDIKRVEHF